MAVARLRDVDWKRWVPEQRATLLFVVRDGRILLIRKKRGLGAGKINGPGGRLDPGESALECAVREIREELCVTPTNPSRCGELSFQFTDGLAIHVTVFIADGCEGEALETEEAEPLWTRIDRIPYEEMWADDRLWIPLMLEGRRFEGRMIFAGDDMLDWELSAEPQVIE